MGDAVDDLISLYEAGHCDESDQRREDDDYHSNYSERRSLRNITCKYCNVSNFHWQYTERGYRLFSSDNKIHLCKAEKTEVYVLEHHVIHEDTTIKGIFSSFEKAQQRKRDLLNERLGSSGTFRVYRENELLISKAEVDK